MIAPTQPATTDYDSTAETPPPLRVLVVDDHAIFRHGILALVKAERAFEVCGEAANAEEALAQLRELRPDMAILDIALGGTNGIELIKLMKAEQPSIQIVMLSMHDESLFALRALRAGAGAYVRKQEAVLNVVSAMRAVSKGEVYLSPRFRDQLAFQAIQSPQNGAPSPVEKLSDRELEVLQHLGIGQSTREIAAALNLSVKTIETHRAHIKEKLNFRYSQEMVRFAIDWCAQQQF